MSYKHLFFDLDHTLWDTDGNSADALRELYVKHNLAEIGVNSIEAFIEKYTEINNQFWEDYSVGKISKQALRYKRFLLALQYFKVKNYDLSYTLSEEYIALAPNKSKVQPHTHELLAYLQNKYILHVITNGFDDAQYSKLKAAGIHEYFVHVVTAERAGYKKPASEIFEYAIKLAKANKAESLMIGDNLQADIIGARAAGIDQVFYNYRDLKHSEKVSYEIKSLLELKNIV